MAKTTKTRESFDKELFKRSVLYNIKTLYRRTLEEATPQQIYQAASLAINPNTIQRAYRELEAEGFIYSIPGKGSFVSPSREISGEELCRRWEDLDRAVRELRFLGVSEEELIRHLKDEGGDAK